MAQSLYNDLKPQHQQSFTVTTNADCFGRTSCRLGYIQVESVEPFVIRKVAHNIHKYIFLRCLMARNACWCVWILSVVGVLCTTLDKILEESCLDARGSACCCLRGGFLVGFHGVYGFSRENNTVRPSLLFDRVLENCFSAFKWLR